MTSAVTILHGGPHDNAGSNKSSSMRAWFALGLFLSLYMLAQIDRNIISLVVAPLRAEFGLTPFQIGLLLGPAFGICYGLFSFPLAWAADRWSRRLVVFFGILVWSLAAMSGGLVTSFAGLFASRLLVGVGEAALLPAAYVIISTLFPKERLALALSILSMGSVGGLALSYGLGSWLLDNVAAKMTLFSFGIDKPWRLIFMLTALPSLLLGFLVWLVPDRKTPKSDVDQTDEPALLLPFIASRKWALCTLLIGFGLSATCSGALIAWLPTYMQMRFHWILTDVGMSLAILVLVFATIGKLGSGLIVDRMLAAGSHDAHARFLMIVLVITLPISICAFFVANPYMFLALMAVWFLLAFPVMGYGSALVQLITPVALRSRMSAIFLLVLNLMATLLGAPIAGFLAQSLFNGLSDLGFALAITLGTWMSVAIILLRMGLKPLAEAVRAA